VENTGRIVTSPTTKDTFREIMKEQERETAECEDRARNILIFGAVESKRIRKEDCEVEDKRFISGFLEKIGMGEISFDQAVRLGVKSNDKCRPLRFRVEDLRSKTSIMDNLFQLRNAEQPYADISVRHDLTPNQREELKKLIKEAKDESAKSEDFLFLVRSRGQNWDPRIIKVKRREAARPKPETLEDH
jgi:hypothetical protein